MKLDYKKATQALNYFAISAGSSINKMKAIKLIYFADRYHLRKYARLITNDIYFAMSYGPVASGVKDIAESSGFLSKKERNYAKRFIEVENGNKIRSIKKIDKNIFSKSDIEALEFAWKKFGKMNSFALVKITHKYPEWKKHENNLKINSRIEMNIEDFLNDPSENIEKCYYLSNEERKEKTNIIKELAYIESLWE